MAAAAEDIEMRGEHGEEVSDLSNPDAVTKYREAATIANTVLSLLIAEVREGKSAAELCDAGDAALVRLTAAAFKAKKIEKGIAFPTCISVNEVVCHYSPLKSEASVVLKAGDVVKVDLGCHIDGYITTVAHTVVVGATAAAPVTGPAANVIQAAHAAAEAALRTIKPGNKNSDVTKAVEAVAAAYGVTPLAGVLMHNMSRYIIDGNKVILLRGDDPETRVEEATFEANEVYTVDVAFSTGEGKPKESELKTTIFKRSPETEGFNLKMKASKALISEVKREHSYMPFSLRSIKDETNARMGLQECVRHRVLQPYPVLAERAGAVVAHFKFTALLLPGGTLKVTGLAAPDYAKSEVAVPAELSALLATEPYAAGKKSKKKAAAAAAAAAGGAGADIDMN